MHVKRQVAHFHWQTGGGGVQVVCGADIIVVFDKWEKLMYTFVKFHYIQANIKYVFRCRAMRM